MLKSLGKKRTRQLLRSLFSDPLPDPKGPKIEKIQDRPPGLKFSIEIEIFNLDPQQTPIFCGEFWSSGIEIFNRD